MHANVSAWNIFEAAVFIIGAAVLMICLFDTVCRNVIWIQKFVLFHTVISIAVLPPKAIHLVIVLWSTVTQAQ
jgi:hypothetical protein